MKLTTEQVRRVKRFANAVWLGRLQGRPLEEAASQALSQLVIEAIVGKEFARPRGRI